MPATSSAVDDAIRKARREIHSVEVMNRPYAGETIEEILRDLVETVQRSQWREMDSAPKDGTRILVLWNNCPVITYWAERPRWSGWQPPSDTPLAIYNRAAWEPALWMPLPAPPQTREEDCKLCPAKACPNPEHPGYAR